jgi:hypothetical protein
VVVNVSQVKFEDAEGSNYRYIYATGAFGNVLPNDARIIFYLDRIVPKTINEGEKIGSQETEKVIRERQVEVHMSPQEFVTLWLWMGERIKLYKESFPDFPLKIPETKITEVSQTAKTDK